MNNSSNHDGERKEVLDGIGMKAGGIKRMPEVRGSGNLDL